MPGIVGLVTDNPDQQGAASQLSRMLGCMRHDPSYTCGTYMVPELGCYLGWLSHKGAYADCNPIVDARGEVVLILTGEHFSHDGAASNGRTASARSLLSLYEKTGDGFVNDLNGWFSGVVVDRRRRAVLLFNDRYGVQRIYYHEGRDAFTFASEAKAILAVRPETRALDPEGLGRFLGFGAVFGNRTLFAGVSLLPGGSFWAMDGPSTIKKQQYFHPGTWEQQPQLDPGTFYSALRDTVSRVLPAYFRSDEPVGLSLTGGLDTRIVMAGIPDRHTQMPSYTYAGVYRDCYDIHVAHDVATACGLSHRKLALGPDFFTNFQAFAEETVWVTDGCLDLCGSHEVYFSRLARKLSLVRLTGNYGSEVLRSVSTFKYNAPPQGLFDPAVVASTTDAARAFAAIRAEHPVTFAAFREIPWNLFGRFAAAQSQLVLRSPYMDNELVALLYQSPPHTRETNETSLRLIADLDPRLAAIPTDMAYGGHTAAPIAKVQQLYRYLQFKAEWYYNAGMPQWFAPFDGAAPLKMLEPLFLGSHKIDHYRLWFRDQLKDYLRSILADSASKARPYLDRRGYEDSVNAFVNGGRNSMNEINKVVTLELIHRLLIERDYENESHR